MSKAYVRPKADHGPNTMTGAPGGLHYLTQNEELGHDQGGLGAKDQAIGIEADFLVGDASGEIENFDCTDPPADLDECTQIRARLALSTSGFVGGGGTITIPVKVYDSGGSLLGTSNVVVANDQDGTAGGGDFNGNFDVFVGSAITGLSLDLSDCTPLRYSYEIPATGFTSGAVALFYDSDLELEYSAGATYTVVDEFSAPIAGNQTFDAPIHSSDEFESPMAGDAEFN